MLNNITPFRQLLRAYSSLLTTATSLAQISAKLDVLPSLQANLETVISKSEQIEPPKPEDCQVPQATTLLQRGDLTLLLDPTSYVDNEMIRLGSWEPAQVGYLMDQIEGRMKVEEVTFLDLGSYWGFYSLMAMRAGVKTIHAFDADRHNFAQLQAQMFLNDATSTITAHNLAVSSQTCHLTFWDSRSHPEKNRGGVGVVSENFAGTTYQVKAVSIDEYLHVCDQFLVIKMDLEGHEPQALAGMTRTISNNRALLQIECFEHNREAILAEVAKLGLRKIKEIGPDWYFTNIPAG